MRKLLLLILFFPFFLFAQNWNQLGNDIDGEAGGDQSGYSVSLSSDGNTVAIGAIDNSYTTGHVRVYNNLGSWTQLGQDIVGEAGGDQSGYSVSLSSDGNTVAIGAIGNDGNGIASGHVKIYNWSGSSWIQLGQDIDGEAAIDRFGFSVSLSGDGNTVAIGAYGNDGNGSAAGHARIYSWIGSSWIQLGQDIDGEAGGDQSGYSVSLSSDGETIAVGAPFNDGNGSDAGHTRIYNYNGIYWNQVGGDINGEAGGDNSGWSVSLSSDGNTVAIGAYGNDGNMSKSGNVRVYSYNGSSWTQLGQDIDGEASNDYSGWSLSLSSDGQTVAIGAYGNDGNGSAAGHARIYSWIGSSWIQLGQDIDGEAGGDQSGYSVSLSSDGETIAVGAPFNDGNGSDAGHVRVYDYSLLSVAQINSISPNSGDQGQTLSVSISGSNMNYGSQWSGTLSDFRFSQWSGSNMFYGNPTSTSGNTLYGSVSISSGQNTGWYDLEVYNQNTNQWVQKSSAFYVNYSAPVAQIISISPSIGDQGQTLSVTISGNNMDYGSQWSGTLSNFRFSQWSGSNMFYGNSTSESGNYLYGNVSIPNGQNQGWYDLEVYNQNTNQWVQKNTAFYVNYAPPQAQINSISPSSGIRDKLYQLVLVEVI